MELADSIRNDTDRHNALVRDSAYLLAADPTKPFVRPSLKEPVPYLNFAPVQNAVAALEPVAERYDQALATRMESGGLAGDEAKRLNQMLLETERLLASDDGLPRRPWFRHTIYAPGFYTGYGVKTLPGIREAVEQRQWDELPDQSRRIAVALRRLTQTLERATAMLAPARGRRAR
jgi:N-acetylated-alpha-linked acidic dipeptidase